MAVSATISTCSACACGTAKNRRDELKVFAGLCLAATYISNKLSQAPGCIAHIRRSGVLNPRLRGVVGAFRGSALNKLGIIVVPIFCRAYSRSSQRAVYTSC
jgi:hypothetical protein